MCAVGFCAGCAQWASAQNVRSGLLRRMCAMGFCAECAQWASAQDLQAVTNLRKPVAAPPQEIMCFCVCGCGTSWFSGGTAKVFNLGEERRRSAFHSASTSGASPGLEDDGEPPLSLVILARCLAGNQPSGPLREEGGGDVSLLGMRPLYFSDIQQEQHSHHL
ncbi:unnamed protein product [Pleuronectes platessa]|uniref:Uncharacterized protein n=1 Tax=Pleuronectes platessa TaxID=8262 RepID=A0A9N7ZCM1_PLEPL|nr:unnamed protein product [Pleuronectes platessa]